VAEHAVACRHHRLTPAQVRAGARSGPALVWQATVIGDVLASTGVPAWFDDDGANHTAWAWTWQHAATGQRASAGTPGYDTAYLPLDLPLDGADGPAVIDLLRDAHSTAGTGSPCPSTLTSTT